MVEQNLVLSSIPIDELKAIISESVRTEVQKLSEAFIAPPISDYISRRETAQILGISLVTLNTWSKTGIIVGYRIGTRVRYKRHEIENALLEINSIKHKRR